jgi:hypothetical protein
MPVNLTVPGACTSKRLPSSVRTIIEVQTPVAAFVGPAAPGTPRRAASPHEQDRPRPDLWRPVRD